MINFFFIEIIFQLLPNLAATKTSPGSLIASAKVCFAIAKPPIYLKEV